MPNKIANKIEEILADDRNFGTRTGLRFTLELVKDAFDYIESEKVRSTQTTERISKIEDRVEDIEAKLDGFLAARRAEQEDAKDERKFYRRAVIGGIISLLIMQLGILLFR